MKNRFKIPFFTVLFFIVFSLPINAQDKPILFDEFHKTPCDNFKSRLNALLWELDRNRDFRGYIVVYPGEDDLDSVLYYVRIIKWYVKDYFNYPFDDLQILFVQPQKEQTIQFWTVAPGQSPPIPQGKTLRISEYEFRKPTLVGDDTDYQAICYPVSAREYFSEILRAQMELQGNLKIFHKSKRAAHKIERNLKKLFAKDEAKDFLARLRFQFVISKSYPWPGTIEYWLIPKSQKAKKNSTKSN
jgi:hypothetical protein